MPVPARPNNRYAARLHGFFKATATATKHDVSRESRDPSGKWTSGANQGKVAKPSQGELFPTEQDAPKGSAPAAAPKTAKTPTPARPKLTYPSMIPPAKTDLWDASKLSTDIVPPAFTEDQTSDRRYPSANAGQKNPSGKWQTRGDKTPGQTFIPKDPVQAAMTLATSGGRIQLDTMSDLDNVVDGINLLTTQYDDAEIPDDRRPIFDFGRIDFKDKPLIATTSKNIPRIQMPQLKGFPANPAAASALQEANGVPEEDRVDKEGKYDLEDAWFNSLMREGIKVYAGGKTSGPKVEVDPSTLKSSQFDMNGAAIAGIFAAVLKGMPPGGGIISNDGYVIDGHHRWASDLLLEARTGRKMKNPYKMIDLPIDECLKRANAFVAEADIAPEPAASAGITGPGSPLRSLGGYEGEVRQRAVDQLISSGGFTFHPASGDEPTTGFMVGMKGPKGESLSVHMPFDPTSEADHIKALRAIKKFAMDAFKVYGQHPDYYIGGWYDEKAHELVLDPTVNVADREEAVRLGTKNNEQSIWDVEGKEEIPTGGTGGDVQHDDETSVGKATGRGIEGRGGGMGGELRPVRPGSDLGRTGSGLSLIPVDVFGRREASANRQAYLKANPYHDRSGRFSSNSDSGLADMTTHSRDFDYGGKRDWDLEDDPGRPFGEAQASTDRSGLYDALLPIARPRRSEPTATPTQNYSDCAECGSRINRSSRGWEDPNGRVAHPDHVHTPTPEPSLYNAWTSPPRMDPNNPPRPTGTLAGGKYIPTPDDARSRPNRWTRFAPWVTPDNIPELHHSRYDFVPDPNRNRPKDDFDIRYESGVA